jgi:hypothetical protein
MYCYDLSLELNTNFNIQLAAIVDFDRYWEFISTTTRYDHLENAKLYKKKLLCKDEQKK